MLLIGLQLVLRSKYSMGQVRSEGNKYVARFRAISNNVSAQTTMAILKPDLTGFCIKNAQISTHRLDVNRQCSSKHDSRVQYSIRTTEGLPQWVFNIW